MQFFAARILNFLNFSRDYRTDSRAYDHHVTNPKTSKFLQQKLQPMQLLEFDFRKIVLSIFRISRIYTSHDDSENGDFSIRFYGLLLPVSVTP